MRANVMFAVASLTKSTLSGVVEFGILQLKQSNKGSQRGNGVLIPPDDVPAYVIYAIDEDGKCACVVHDALDCMADELCAFVDERTCNITVACSNDDSVFIDAFERLDIAHYVKPKTCDEALRLLFQTRGGFDASDSDQLLEFELAQHRGLVDRIQGNPALNIEGFLRMKEEMELSTEAAEEFGFELRQRVIADKAGVSGRYLSLYVGWEEYRHNLEASLGRPLDPHDDSLRVLSDAISAHVRLSASDLRMLRMKG